MDAHDTKATVALIGELWPTTVSEPYGLSPTVWKEIAKRLGRMRITFTQAQACLTQHMLDVGNRGTPDVGKMLRRLDQVGRPPAGGTSDSRQADAGPLAGKTFAECAEAWADGKSAMAPEYEYMLPAVMEEVEECRRTGKPVKVANVLARLRGGKPKSPMSMTAAEMYGEDYLRREATR